MKTLKLFLVFILVLSCQNLMFGQKIKFPNHPGKDYGIPETKKDLIPIFDSQLLDRYIEITNEYPDTNFVQDLSRYNNKHFQLDKNNRVHVEIGVPGLRSEYLSALNKIGFELLYENDQFHRYDGWLPLKSFNKAKHLKFISFIRAIELPITSATTAGDFFHRTVDVRNEWQGINGTGIKVGIISDGINWYAASQAANELPDIDILGIGDVVGNEGTAMLEIVHDMAEGAELAFNGMGLSESGMANNIQELADAGCNIICDDIGYYHEPVFQDGVIANKINEVVNSGAIYISSAGNSKSEHYIGNYQNAGDNFNLFTLNSGISRSYLDVIVPSGEFITAVLQWNDEYGKSGNDYDLYLYYENFDFYAKSSTTQNGDDDPYENISRINPSSETKTYHIAVLNKDGNASPRKLNIILYEGILEEDAIIEESSIAGHPSASGCIAVGAISQGDRVRTYSSAGPALIYSYDVNGNPGAHSERIKPDISAIDGVETYTGQQGHFDNPFYGTSASAPHVAGIAALLWSADRTKTNNQIRSAIETGALPIPDYGTTKNNIVGEGRADALNSMLLIKSPVPPTITITSPANGSEVTGECTINATASDASGISKVEFYVDNEKKGEDYTDPYSISWSTLSYSNGPYILTVKAYDNIGGIAEKSVNVNVNNQITGPILLLSNTANIPNPVSYSGGNSTITVNNTGTGTLTWNTQDVPAWVHLSPANGSTISLQNVTVQIDANSTGVVRNCQIRFYNSANTSNYQYLPVYQSAEPAATSDWEMFQKNYSHSGYQNAYLNTAVGVEWMKNSTTGLSTYMGPVIVGNKIIIAGSDAITCYSTAGTELWRKSPFYSNSYPAVYNDVLFIADDQDAGEGKLYAINVNTGTTIASSSGTAPFEGVITADASGIYVPCDLVRIYAFTFNGSSITLKWTFDSNAQFGQYLEYLNSGVALDGTYVYFNGVTQDDHYLYGIRLNKATGSYVNHFLVTDPAIDIDKCNTPVIYNNLIYFTYDVGATGVLRCVNSSLSNVWQYSAFSDYRITPPVAYNSRIYVGDDNGYVYCFNYSTGSLYFSDANGGSIEKGMAITNNCLVALRDSELDLLSLTDGSELIEVDLGLSHYAAPAVIGNKIIAINQDEAMYCISDVFQPEAYFTGTPISGYVPMTVNFTDGSNAGSSPINSWFWDFGDETTSTLKDPSHSYTSSGQYTVTLTVSSASGSDSYTRTNYITVNAPPVLTFIPSSHNYSEIISGICSENYTFILKNNGGGIATGNIELSNQNDFEIVSGGGIFSLASQATQNIIVRFCPSSGGEKSVSLVANASSPSNSPAAALTGIGIEPNITLTSPNGGNLLVKGSAYDISWTDNIADDVRIELYKNSVNVLEITPATTSDGNHSWDVPGTLESGSDYKIRITDANNVEIWDESDEAFVINDPCLITITAPGNGVQFNVGSDIDITWTGNFTDNVRIELYKNDTYNSLIVNSTENDGEFTWSIPSDQSLGADYRIQIMNVNYQSCFGLSDGYFEIENAIPAIDTRAVQNIAITTALSGGIIESDGGYPIIQKGVCWGTEPQPTIEINDHTLDGAGNETFQSTVSGLSPGITYYVRAYAQNVNGTGYGNDLSFTTYNADAVQDDEGNYYNTITIGYQVWMAENLRYLPFVSPLSIGSVNASHYYVYNYPGSSVSEAKATVNYNTYGVLYNWPAAKNACPEGWRLPSDYDWKVLEMYLGMSSYDADQVGTRGIDEGSKLAGHEELWTDGTLDSHPSFGLSGFDAVPGGYRSNSAFTSLNSRSIWWTSTPAGNNTPWWRFMQSDRSSIVRDAYAFTSDYGFSVRCMKELIVNPTVTTGITSDITPISAVCSGDVTSQGGSAIIEKGICYNDYAHPTIESYIVSSGSGTESFTATLTGLKPGITYHVRAFATNSTGTSYGDEITFTTYNADAIQDADGNYYNILTIGNQTWMQENLKTTKYNDLSGIPLVTDISEWTSLNTPAYCWYENDDIVYGQIYGALYNWYAVSSTANGGKNVCPVGWHVPSNEEWSEMENYLITNGFNYDGTTTDNKIAKSLATASGWEYSTVTGAVGNTDFPEKINLTGFTAKPGGFRNYTESYYGSGSYGIWWTSTETSSSEAWSRFMYTGLSSLDTWSDIKKYGYSVRCIMDPGVPTVTTNDPHTVTKNSAVSGGVVKTDGGSPVISRGVCWSISPNPTVSYSSYTVDGSDRGEFTSELSGLLPGTPYYLRAYATNISGTGYGEEITFTTYNSNAIQDIDGNFYNQVTIGSQTWLEENLRVTRFNDGTPIDNLSDSSAWVNSTGPAYCWYDNDIDLKDIYGALYKWEAVSNEKLCPAGWHVPTDVDWLQLETYIGMDPAEADLMNTWRGTTEGNKLKETGTEHWLIPNIGTNETGFTALPSGFRDAGGNFWGIRQDGYFWTSSEFLPSQVIVRVLDYEDETIYRACGNVINAGLPVRCVRNDVVIQSIDLTEGWNIVSLAVSPSDLSMATIVEPLIASMHFNKLQDESGKAVEYLPDPIGWINEIGQMSVTEGYKIRVEGPVSLTVTGQPASLPIDIPLETGWNIIGYPSMTSQSASSVFGTMISEGSLLKVQDETGASIEQIGGEWIYGFENLIPGEGYRIKVGNETILTMTESQKKSAVSYNRKASEPHHFHLAYNGNGLDHMNIYLSGYSEERWRLHPGDEIGIFDEGVCVGVAMVENTGNKYMSVIVSLDDPVTQERDGFTEGDEIEVRLWDNDAEEERNTSHLEPVSGYSKVFEKLGTAVLKVEFREAGSTSLGDAYPNPSDERTTFTINLADKSRVCFEIFDTKGQKIRILLDKTLPEGYYEFEWDNKTETGNKVKSGVYLYRLTAGSEIQTKQLVIH